MGIEARHPFSDRRVIEFFLLLPLKMKTFAPLPKRVIRAGMKGILPERSDAERVSPIPAVLSQHRSWLDQRAFWEPVTFSRILASVGEYVRTSIGGGDESARVAWRG